LSEIEQLRNAMMTRTHRSITAVLMTIALVAGRTGLMMAGFQDCPPPKACYCTKGAHTAAAHAGEAGAKSGCTGSVPCCHPGPLPIVYDIAATFFRSESPQPKVFIQTGKPIQQFATLQAASLARIYQHNDKPGASRTPLYLETQMILC
jgi:hypothetical protein